MTAREAVGLRVKRNDVSWSATLFTRIENGWMLIAQSLRVFRAHPRLLVPLLFTWTFYAPAVIYLEYYLPWDSYSNAQVFGIAFLAILFFSVIISTACLVLLELIAQIERGFSLDLARATAAALPNVLRAFPVTLIWSTLWFLLTALEALFSREDDDEPTSDPDVADIARTLSGFEHFTLSAAFFEALNRGLRMLAFLIYPAIAWEGSGPVTAIKKGLGVARMHKVEFATGYTMTAFVSAVIFFPPGVLIAISTGFHATLPRWLWSITILYSALAWCLTILLEQLFTAELYLWHLVWDRERHAATGTDGATLLLTDVPSPSLLDRVASMTDGGALSDPAN